MRGMKSLAALMGMMAMASAPVQQANSMARISQSANHEVILKENKAVQPTSKKRLTNGNVNGWHISGKWAGGNQRQHRKRWRQCPWTRPAKNRK